MMLSVKYSIVFLEHNWTTSENDQQATVGCEQFYPVVSKDQNSS